MSNCSTSNGRSVVTRAFADLDAGDLHEAEDIDEALHLAADVVASGSFLSLALDELLSQRYSLRARSNGGQRSQDKSQIIRLLIRLFRLCKIAPEIGELPWPPYLPWV